MLKSYRKDTIFEYSENVNLRLQGLQRILNDQYKMTRVSGNEKNMRMNNTVRLRPMRLTLFMCLNFIEVPVLQFVIGPCISIPGL